jgi:hypothetical protein
MAKKQKETELEFLRGLVRKLKSENRHLRKLLGGNSKKLNALESNIAEAEVAEEELGLYELKPANLCPKCSESLETADLGSRLLYSCKKCTFRKTQKK